MGVVNVTPDSFYSRSRVSGVEEGIIRSLEMIEQGASIIDIGGSLLGPVLNQCHQTRRFQE